MRPIDQQTAFNLITCWFQSLDTVKHGTSPRKKKGKRRHYQNHLDSITEEQPKTWSGPKCPIQIRQHTWHWGHVMPCHETAPTSRAHTTEKETHKVTITNDNTLPQTPNISITTQHVTNSSTIPHPRPGWRHNRKNANIDIHSVYGDSILSGIKTILESSSRMEKA